eukprot:scaffold85555_cov31-Tisochrysis_lutea.AAC.2
MSAGGSFALVVLLLRVQDGARPSGPELEPVGHHAAALRDGLKPRTHGKTPGAADQVSAGIPARCCCIVRAMRALTARWPPRL